MAMQQTSCLYCRSYLGEGSNAGEASTSEAGNVEALRQKRHGPSRYFSERAGTFAEALAGESTGVTDQSSTQWISLGHS